MINWHLSTCRRPDIKFLDIGVPSCLSCGEVGTIDEVSLASAARKPPETPQQADFKLRWPASLPFIEDVPDNHGSATQSKPASPAAISPSGVGASGETPAATGIRGNATAPAKTSLYEPLDTRKIRILQLLPGEYHDPIRCNIQTEDLQSRPEYEALSYTWADSTGDTSLSQPIYVGDCHDILLITVNCANALRRLRFRDRSRDVWVDAICIDQDNIAERSHQVGIMQYIYATAQRVLIYLGEDADDPDPGNFVPWMYENHGNTLKLNTDLSKISYFTRVWVIQEVALARSAWVLLGSRGAKWLDILNHPNLLTSHHPWLQLVAQRRHRDLSELWSLLSATVQCQASDPRDRVFALLGLFIGSNDAGLIPDYSISFSQVICGLTALSFRQYPDLWPQIFAMVKPHSQHGLPTWTVDWTKVRGIAPRFLESRPLISIPFEDRSQNSANNKSARFCRDGSLVVEGTPLFSLLDCTFATQAEDGSGAIHDIRYEPDAPTSVRVERIESSRWAHRSDKLYSIAGLRNELLILRPLECTNKLSFVGICRKFSTRSSSGLVSLLDQKKSLLFSMWNTILGHHTEDWLVPRGWDDMRNVCLLIRQSWKLENTGPSTVGSLLRLRKALEEERRRRDRSRDDDTKSYLEDIYTLRIEPTEIRGQHLKKLLDIDLTDFLLPVCWYYEKGKDQNEGHMPRNNPKFRHGLYGHSGYSEQHVTHDFWWRLSCLLHSWVTCRASGHESAASLLGRLMGQQISTKRGLQLEALLYRYNERSRLFKQDLEDDIVFLRWIRNSMELVPDSCWTPEMHSISGKATSVETFCDVWKGLFWRPGPASSNELPNPTILERDLDQEGIKTESFDEEVEVGKWKFTASFEEKAWNMLHQLVRETEKHLLPLEVAFLEDHSAATAATCANKTEEMKLEDVYIV